MAKLLGSETPRIWTAPLRELEPRSPETESRTLGYDAIDFAEQVIGMTLYPWQRWLLIHALELRPEGGFRFRKIVLLVARQQGKSTLCQILSLFFLYMLGTELVLGTAQDLDTAEEVWEGALDIIEDTPELAELMDKPIKAAGKKAIRLKTGERYKIKAANRRAGRGLSGDLVLLDELREHQSWDSWAAITGTTNARDNAQIWALSNAGDATSIVLRHLRKMAHLALGDPDGINSDGTKVDNPDPDGPDEVEADDTLGIFEWSAPANADVRDRDGWAQANPSLGHGGVTERTLASAAATDPEWVFRTECLCQWSDGTLEGPFPPGAWDAGRFDPDHPPQIEGNVVACVDTSSDRIKTYIAFAGRQENGRLQVELVAERAGQDWVEGWLRERADLIDAVTGQTRGAPVSALMGELRANLAGEIPVEDWVAGDVPGWTGKFYDLVRGDDLSHNPWPSLDLAAATAVPKLTEGGAFMWDRKRSPIDIAPLVAATGAVGLLTRPAEEVAVSAYESRGVLSI